MELKEGISQEQAKKVGKLIRDDGPKGIKVQVQGDELRVTSKKRDDLQAVIALVKGQDYDFPVQKHETPTRGGGRVPGGMSIQWQVKDSNLRRLSRRIYSPLPLATRATCRGAPIVVGRAERRE